MHRPRRLIGQVHLALAQTLEQLVDRQVDDTHFVRPVEHRVRDRLAHDHTSDLRDDVVEALEVLDVHRREDVDARVEQLDHVLPALWVAGAGRVGVGQLVDEDELRMPRERAVEVELVELDPAVLDDPARQELEPHQHRARLVAAVRLDDPDHDVALPILDLQARGLEHRVRLADAGGGAEEDRQLAERRRLFFLAQPRDQLIGVGTTFAHTAGPVTRT